MRRIRLACYLVGLLCSHSGLVPVLRADPVRTGEGFGIVLAGGHHDTGANGVHWRERNWLWRHGCTSEPQWLADELDRRCGHMATWPWQDAGWGQREAQAPGAFDDTVEAIGLPLVYAPGACRLFSLEHFFDQGERPTLAIDTSAFARRSPDGIAPAGNWRPSGRAPYVTSRVAPPARGLIEGDADRLGSRYSDSDSASAAVFVCALGLVLVAAQFYRKKQNA